MSTRLLWHQKLPVLIITTVLTALVQVTHGQSFLLTLNQNQQNIYAADLVRDAISNPLLTTTTTDAITSYSGKRSNHSDIRNTLLAAVAEEQEEDNNSTIIVIQSIVHEKSANLSETAMDVITILWYVATFLALAAFFLLMMCSNRRCNGSERATGNRNNNDSPIAPPTPSPSYSEFAPPSYETVMKMQHAAPGSGIFFIPVSLDEASIKDSSNDSNIVDIQSGTPALNFYTINELQKLGS